MRRSARVKNTGVNLEHCTVHDGLEGIVNFGMQRGFECLKVPLLLQVYTQVIGLVDRGFDNFCDLWVVVS